MLLCCHVCECSQRSCWCSSCGTSWQHSWPQKQGLPALQHKQAGSNPGQHSKHPQQLAHCTISQLLQAQLVAASRIPPAGALPLLHALLLAGAVQQPAAPYSHPLLQGELWLIGTRPRCSSRRRQPCYSSGSLHGRSSSCFSWQLVKRLLTAHMNR